MHEYDKTLKSLRKQSRALELVKNEAYSLSLKIEAQRLQKDVIAQIRALLLAHFDIEDGIKTIDQVLESVQ